MNQVVRWTPFHICYDSLENIKTEHIQTPELFVDLCLSPWIGEGSGVGGFESQGPYLL